MGENGENRTGVEGRGKESWGEKGRREDGSSSFALGKKGVGVYNRNCDKSIYNCYS